MYVKTIAELVVKNYSKSFHKPEDGIIIGQLLLRVILQKLKCLCHDSE